MSGTFQQVMHELGIKQYKSSAYYPKSQGASERFHQTLKNMIRSYCFDTEKDWDKGIHLLLFAVRESVQEGTRRQKSGKGAIRKRFEVGKNQTNNQAVIP